MSEQDMTWEAAVRKTAASFSYPPTPDIAAGVRQRLAKPGPRRRPLALAYALLLLALLAGLLAVPPVRAALVNVIRAGAISIFVGEPTATPAAANEMPALATQLATVAEPVTPAQAQAQFRHPLQAPPLLGEPDEVWLHQVDRHTAVIFIWRSKAQPQEITASLYQIDAAQYAYKGAQQLEITAVNEQRAFWIKGPHPFLLQDDTLEFRQLTAGSVLLWWAGDVTYRLEGASSMAEAVSLAESLRPVEIDN